VMFEYELAKLYHGDYMASAWRRVKNNGILHFGKGDEEER
jgi:hypothetical protein